MQNDALVFRLELPFDLAPTLNRYAHLHRYARGKIAKRVDGLILEAKGRWPSWDMGCRRHVSAYVDKRSRVRTRTTITGGRRRLVSVTRESCRLTDELVSADLIGGKIPIDRLVLATVLRDDSTRWAERRAQVIHAPPKRGRVVIEVYELGLTLPDAN